MLQTILEKLKNEVKFDEENHIYWLNGQMLTGVTSVLNVRQKEFLKWWAAKMVVTTLEDKQEAIKKMTDLEYKALLEEAKKAHTKVANEAKGTGKAVHAWLENFLKTGKAGEAPVDEKAKLAIKAFWAWQKENKVKWLASEVIVVSKVNSFAGTLDALAELNGKLTLVDFKTNNQLSEDVALQTAAYQIALEEAGIKPEQRLALRLGKDGTFESVIIRTPLDFDKSTFLNLREVYRWNLLIENHFTEEFIDEKGKKVKKVKLDKSQK